MSISQRRRLGIPDGHVRIYGQHIPEVHAAPIRYWAYWIAGKLGRCEAERFVTQQVDLDYPDIAMIREKWEAKLDARHVRNLVRAIQATKHDH